jgi:hypothetical protein
MNNSTALRQAKTRNTFFQIQVEAEREKRRRLRASESTEPGYATDPAGYIEKVLGAELTEEQRKVCESVRDYPVTIVKSANGTGKTYDAARLAIWFYKSFPDAQVYTTAAPPEGNLKRLLWGELGSAIAQCPKVFSADEISNLLISVPNQINGRRAEPSRFIAGVTIPTSGTEQQREAKFSGKHAPNLFFIVDEGDAVPDEVYRGIDACMSGGNARLLIMFNPRNESGPVYRMERDRLANVITLSAFNHPNVVSGEDRIPGAVTRSKTVKRLNEWSRPMVAGEKRDNEFFEVPPYLAGVVATSNSGAEYPPLAEGWRKITDPALAYMVLGQYPAQSETQLISRAWISAARTRWDLYVAAYGETPPEGVKPIQGQDVAEFGSDENCATFRYGGFVARPITWSGVDTTVTVDKASELCKRHGAVLVNVDSTGVGAGVAPGMVRAGCEAERIMVASSPTQRTEQGEFNILRDQLLWATREWLRTDTGSMLPPDEHLLEELATPTYSIEGGKIRVMKKDVMKDLLKRSPDRLDSLALTFADQGVRSQDYDDLLDEAISGRGV